MKEKPPHDNFVTSLSVAELQNVVDIHLQAFAGYMNAKLGRFYINKFIYWFAVQPNSIAQVAKSPEGIVKGYVIGAPLGYDRQMNQEMLWAGAKSLLLRPWLLLERNFCVAIADRVRTIMGVIPVSKKLPNLPSPVMSLVGIGVAPQAQGKGIGKLLMKSFEEKASQLHMKSMRLSVYPNNLLARKLYESCGWNAFNESLQPGKAMFYYKVLSE